MKLLNSSFGGFSIIFLPLDREFSWNIEAKCFLN